MSESKWDEQIERMAEAWPRLADGLFDFLADIDVPAETLADLDVAIRACRVLAEIDLGAAAERVGRFDFFTWPDLPPDRRRVARERAEIIVYAALGLGEES